MQNHTACESIGNISNSGTTERGPENYTIACESSGSGSGSGSINDSGERGLQISLARGLRDLHNRKAEQWATNILPYLYLGSGTNASDIEKLYAHAVFNILNVSDDVPNFHAEEKEGGKELAASPFNYLKLDVADFGQDEGIMRVFERSFHFLEENEAMKQPVLIHCAAGANRSATLTIAWLMKRNQWTLREAWAFVRNKRNICPQTDNRKQLLLFEYEMFGKNSYEEEEFLRCR